MNKRTMTMAREEKPEPRLKPESPEWHAHLANFWREEIKAREVRVEEAKAELAAAKRAYGEHCEAAGWNQCDCCGEMKECDNVFAYGLDAVVCEDCRAEGERR